jgi:2-keto-4-pentenoate hydratase
MDRVEIEQAVEAFAAARGRGEHFPAAWHDRLSLDDAYRIQLALVHRGAADPSRRRIGWKVGLTSVAIQQQFGVHEPVFGCLLAEGHLTSGHVFGADLIRPGFENEICVALDRDLAPGVTVDAVSAAIGTVFPALEIIETRGDFTRQLALALADNAQQKAFVLGPPVSPGGLDLATVTARVRVNGAEVGVGRGDAVLGHPFHSVAWLAGKLAQFGERLRAGDLVMTGSFTRQFPLSPGDRVETVFEGVGSVSASLA